MKYLMSTLMVGAAVVGFTTSTFAADLIIDEPVEAGVVDVSGTWDGVFIGGFVGGGRGTGHRDVPDPEEPLSTLKVESVATDPVIVLPVDGDYDLSGWLAGVNLGANVTVADGIVAGVVADIAWSNIGDGDAVEINWTGSLRGRLGIDGGAFLPYLTGGLAVANVDLYGDDQTHLGWTVGAGVEVAVAEDLSLDLLYRYSDYGAVDDFSLNTHQVTVGLNWRF